MIHIVCFWWGNWCGEWGPKYVKRLREALKGNTSVDFSFLCFTDNPDAFECETIEFEPYLKGNLNKFQCFDPQFSLDGNIVSFDLDTLIIGNVDSFLHFNNLFVTQKNMRGMNVAGGGIIGAKSWYGNTIFEHISKNRKKVEEETKGAERIYIRKYMPRTPFWQVPGVYSYKWHGIPKDARVINFHGKPRPHETEIGRHYLEYGKVNIS